MDALEASKILSDEYSAKILMGAIRKPRTALELSRDFNIPIAACYRRIRNLEDNGLIRCVEKRLTFEGKRVATYQSLLKSAHIFFEGGSIKARFEWITGEIEDLQLELEALRA
jgi:DNA-binding Lrp family transcriptional regulator